MNYDLFPIFNSLSELEKEYLESRVLVKKYRHHEVIHIEGDRCLNLEMVENGVIHIEQLDIEGNSKVIQDYSRGAFFGLNFLFASNNSYLMNVIAEGNTTIHYIDKAVISLFITNNDVFRFDFIKLLSDNNRRVGMKIKTDFRLSLREKIISYIKKESIKQKRSEIYFHTTKTNLALQFGVERTSLSRELQKMKKDSIIEYSRDTVRLLDF